jgi:hypothetical protein
VKLNDHWIVMCADLGIPRTIAGDISEVGDVSETALFNNGLTTNTHPKCFRNGSCGLVRECEYLGVPREQGEILAGT